VSVGAVTASPPWGPGPLVSS